MVTISIYLEGGAQSPQISIDNTIRLRESFYKLFKKTGGVDENIDIKIVMCGSSLNTVREFCKAKSGFLLLDMDGKDFYETISSPIQSNRQNHSNLLLLNVDSLSTLKRKRINQYGLRNVETTSFFMIQTMESFILSQPDKIAFCFKDYRVPDKSIETDPIYINNVDVQEIAFPDGELDGLMQKYFIKNNHPLKYGKLKNSYEIISHLDIIRLKNYFREFEELITEINKTQA